MPADSKANTSCPEDQARRLRAISNAWFVAHARERALDILEDTNSRGGVYAHPAHCSCCSCRAIAKRRNQQAVA